MNMKDAVEKKPEKRITIGILAHVDAGKTTLSEALLVASGILPKAGRVDHGNSYLDTDVQEKQRGITIFSGEARMMTGNTEVILVDTPGHVDFSAEMERTLSVLDYAMLVISGRELVQGHTVTIWNLLKKLQIPVFLFVNKMDLEGTDKERAMKALQSYLDDGCVSFSDVDPEELAMRDEGLMDAFLAGEELTRSEIAGAIARRRIFPCWFGSALRQEGIEGLLEGLDLYTQQPFYGSEFAARVYRISRDRKGTRLTHMKILGGRLQVRDQIVTGRTEDGQEIREKVHQIRICSADSFETQENAVPGQLAAVTGLEHTAAGQGLGALGGRSYHPFLQPVLMYRLIPEEGASIPVILQQLRQLEEEDPQLHITWNEALQEIQVRLMGEIQLEVLRQIVEERFGFSPCFDEGRIEYRETIAAPVRGAGHFEPLRHYAEVHLLLEPLPPGSGLVVESHCSSDELDTNWQRLITTHLTEREHPGVLTGAPVTDMRISIEAGRAHLKHTEGGDFRQATYRALRQGLRKAAAEDQAVLLEPWYTFRMDLPREQLGRAMADVQKMGGSFETEEPDPSGNTEDMVILRGRAPVQQMRGYGMEVASYTRGYGRFSCSPDGYSPCHNQEEIVRESGYDPDRDLDNPADSVFCSHGAGRNIPWDEADEMMHVSPDRRGAQGGPEEMREHGSGGGGPEGIWDAPGGDSGAPAGKSNRGNGRDSAAEEKELNRFFQHTISRNKKDKAGPRKEARTITKPPVPYRPAKTAAELPEYLLVDGYNIIFAWEELRELAKVSIDAAREALIDVLANYQGFHKCSCLVVFDAYKVKDGREHTEKHGGITVVFTKEAQTADTYIERASYEMKKKYHVRVATSDRLEQMIIMGNDAFRVSAADLQAEVTQVNDRIREILEQARLKGERESKNRIVLP